MKSSLSGLMGFMLLLLFSTEAWGADFQKGLEAYNKKDYKTALSEWEPLTEEGHAEAQFMLGMMYRNGRGVPQNSKTAAKWWILAAQQGHVKALYNLGQTYFLGISAPKNYKIALYWFTLAAQQGHATAQNILGGMYYEGRGVDKNLVYAYMWFDIAASQGNKKAVQGRDRAAKRMSPAQIEKAQNLTDECEKNKYKGCIDS